MRGEGRSDWLAVCFRKHREQRRVGRPGGAVACPSLFISSVASAAAAAAEAAISAVGADRVEI